MSDLRAKNGCPWDKKQTHETLKMYLLEETYEVLEAIDKHSPESLKEELGDLLFQIIFHCQLAKESGDFDIEDVIEKINTKMISRHPHVFGDAQFKTPEEVIKEWHQRKKGEGKFKHSLLDGVPKELPTLLRSQILQERVAKVGFEWENTQGVLDKLDEELSELKDAIKNKTAQEIGDEIGDVFFILVSLSRYLKLNAEEVLGKTIDKFIYRFSYIEKKVKKMKKDLSSMTLQEMDKIWDEAKIKEIK